MRHKRAVALATMVATGLLSGAAFGQIKDEIIVQGKYLSIDKLNAVKTPTPLVDIPQSVSVLDEQQIKDQSFVSIGDVLRYTPGLAVSQGEGHRDAIIIRGNQTTADFFIDGLRDDVQYFRPLYNVQQIEILKGANALLFGRGGGGGIINRVTKRAEFGEQFTSLTGGADSFGAYSFAGDTNFAINNAAFRLNAFYEEIDNHRDFVDGSRFAINPTFALELGPDTELSLSYEHVNDDRIVDRGVPSVTVANGPDAPLEGFDNTFFGSPDQNVTSLFAHIVRARLDHTFSDYLRGNLSAQYADYDKLYQNLFPVGFDAAANTVTLDGYRDPTQRQSLIIQGNLIGEFKTGSIGHTILFGGEYGNQDTRNLRDDTFFPSTADDQATFLFADPLVIPQFSFANRVRDRESEVKFTSVYFQDQIDLTDWLMVVGGVRYDRFDIDVLDIQARNNGAQANFGRVDEEWSPRGGVIVKPAENMSLYASYSESFLPRSGDQFLTLNLSSQGLEPSSFENIEIGAKWDITDALSLTAAVFRLEREQVVTVDPADPANILILDGTKTKGFELEVTGNITEKWFVHGGFSYLDGQVEGGANDGNKTRQTPELMLSAWTRYQVTDKLGLGLGVTHQSDMFVREDNAVEIPDFTRVDAAIYYDINEHVSIQANVENLFNTDYFPDAHSNDNITTGEPINGRIALTLRF